MKTLTTRVLVISMMACAGSAMGQNAEKPLLSGPEVKDSRPALVEDSFGSDMKKTGKERLGALDAIPAADLRQILREMASPEADPLIQLSPEQSERIRELMREYEQDRRAYVQENREEFEALRKAAGIGGDRGRPEMQGRDPAGPERANRRERPGAGQPEDRGPAREGRPDSSPERGADRGPNRGPAGDPGRGPDREMDRGPRRGPAGGPEGEMPPPPPPTPEQEAARLELREFLQAGPSTGDLQRRIYAELSPEQQRFIDDEVFLRAEERAQERDMATIERKRQDRAKEGQDGRRPNQAPGGQPPAGGNRERIDWSKVTNADGSINIEALPERLRQRLEGLDEAQRERALNALKRRIEQGQRLRTGDPG